MSMYPQCTMKHHHFCGCLAPYVDAIPTARCVDFHGNLARQDRQIAADLTDQCFAQWICRLEIVQVRSEHKRMNFK